MTYAIGPVPTPNPSAGSTYTPQLTGGQIYNDSSDTNWDFWNKGWNEGYNNPTKSYSGSDKSFGSGYLIGQQEYAKRSNTTPTSPIPNNTNTINTIVNPTSNTAGFDMKYYPGWGENEARADWIATGGSKANQGSSSPQAPVKKEITTSGGQKISYDPNNAKTDILSQMPNSDYASFADIYSPEQFFAENGEIDKTFNSQQDFLNKAETTANTEKQSALESAQMELNAAQNRLGQSKTQQEATIAQNQVLAAQRKADALSSATRSYNEMLQGSRQRFGGASSAGEASQALLGRSAQEQMGLTQRDYQNTIASIENEKVGVEQNYQASLQDLTVQMVKARNDIQSSFNQRIQAINQSRVTSEENKANARLAVLQNMRDQAFQLKQQEDMFKQQIEQAKIEQQMSLDTYAKQLAIGAKNTTNTFSNWNQTKTPTMTYQTNVNNPLNQQSTITQATGMINPVSKYNPRNEDYFLR